jgi:hypothetical protein
MKKAPGDDLGALRFRCGCLSGPCRGPQRIRGRDLNLGLPAGFWRQAIAGIAPDPAQSLELHPGTPLGRALVHPCHLVDHEGRHLLGHNPFGDQRTVRTGSCLIETGRAGGILIP